MKSESIVHVYKSRDETFYVFKGSIFYNIKSIKEYVKNYYTSSDITFVEMDKPTESYWRQKL